ncbi:MAG: hypothetical protein HFJ58_06245 [Clostridia bacterium]|nr:hypothetical protein [Clostridia bacterium]
MKEIIKNKKVLYILTLLIIVLGIVSIFVFRLNFTLMYSEHTKINVYLGKEYNLQDIKNVVEETLGKQEIIYQEIEVFKDSIAINIKSANEEQIKALETKLRETYEIGENEQFVAVDTVGHIRGRDMIKPYVIPMIIVTIVILAYVGVRYLNLGLLKVITTLILRLIISQALFLSVIAIIRIPIGVYTIPLAILIYIAVVTYTVVQNENRLEKNKENEKKK